MDLPDELNRSPELDDPFKAHIPRKSRDASHANPELTKYLDEWADTYFAAPQAEREVLVTRLLQELRQASAFPAADVRERAGDLSSEQATSGQSSSESVPVQVRCPACAEQTSAQHKFCGFCGSLLRGPQPPPEKNEFFAPVAEPLDSQVDRETSASDVDWLRGRTLPSILELEEPQRSIAWGRITVVLVLLIGGILFLTHRQQWIDRIRYVTQHFSRASQTPPAPPASGAATQPPSPVMSDAKPDAAPPGPTPAPVAEKAQGTPQNASATGAHDLEARADDAQALASSTDVPKPREDETDQVYATGAEELAFAERYLAPANGTRDSAQAAKWLWRAVGKENGRALVLLSDLYARGDGVPKSCDQARLLLVAAAKKEVVEAGPKLRTIETVGCR